MRKTLLLTLLILSCLTFQTIAYSALQSTLSISGIGKTRVQSDVRITDFKVQETNGNAISSYEEFGREHISFHLNLSSPQDLIFYEIEITNYGPNDVGIYEIKGLPDNIDYDMDYNLKTKLCDENGKCNSYAKKVITLMIYLNEGTFDGSVQLNFDFREFYTITSYNFQNEYNHSMIKGNSIRIDLTNENLEDLYVYQDGNEITDYVFENNILTLNNISGNIELTTVYTKHKNNLQGYYPLSENLNDLSTIRRFGDLITQSTVTPYYENGALLINGIGLRTINTNTLPDNFTIIIDFFPNALDDNYHHIWGIWLGENTPTAYNSLSHKNKSIQIQNGSSSVSTDNTYLEEENWYRLIVTGTLSQWDLYVNGKHALNTTTTFEKKQGYLYIGKNIESSVFLDGEPSINGYVKNLRIYDSVLTSKDISILGKTK